MARTGGPGTTVTRPTVYVVDRRGRVRYGWEGELKLHKGASGEETVRKLVDSLLLEIREPAAALTGAGSRVALSHPGTFIIDQEGVIRHKLFLEGHRVRHSTEELGKAAKTVK